MTAKTRQYQLNRIIARIDEVAKTSAALKDQLTLMLAAPAATTDAVDCPALYDAWQAALLAVQTQQAVVQAEQATLDGLIFVENDLSNQYITQCDV